MDIQKIEPVNTNRIHAMENELQTFSGKLIGQFGILIALISTFVFWIAATFAVAPVHSVFMALLLMIGLLAAPTGAWIAFFRMYFSTRKLWLPEDARRFMVEHDQEFKALRGRRDRFNAALAAQQDSQPLLTDGDEAVAGDLARFWHLRGTLLQHDIDDFTARFERAAAADLAAVHRRRQPSSVAADPAWSRRVLEYKRQCRQLDELEESLAKFSDGGFEDTGDLAPYLAVARLRDRLAAKRTELIAEGASEKLLPRLSNEAPKLLASG